MRSDCRSYSSSIGSGINRIIKGPASYLSFGMRYPTSLKIGDKSLLFLGKTIEKIRLWVKGKKPTISVTLCWEEACVFLRRLSYLMAGPQ